MRSVEEQQARVAAAAVAPRPVRVAIAEAQGLMCAEEVVTERPLPGFDQAAIDGYAVRSVDVLGVGAADGDDARIPRTTASSEVSLPGDGLDRGGRAHAEPAAAAPGRARADRRADADAGRRGAAVAVDRRR